MQRPPEFTAAVKNGHLPDRTRQAIAIALRGYEGKAVKISIREVKMIRSPAQNAYYWSVVVPHWKEIFRNYGTIVTDAEVHAYLVSRIGKLLKPVVGPEGDPVMHFEGTHENKAQAMLRTLLSYWWPNALEKWRPAALAVLEGSPDEIPVMEPMSTAKLTTKEHSDFVEACRAEAASEHGHIIPPPDPLYKEKKRGNT